jgi:hypothetical protein
MISGYFGDEDGLSLFREKTSTSRGRMNHGQDLVGGGESWF